MQIKMYICQKCVYISSILTVSLIRELVESPHGTDAQYMQYLRQKPYNFTTGINTLKAYLSAQMSSLSAFVISKTDIVAQKSCGRQLSTKVCGIESAQFFVLYNISQTI